MTFSPQYWPHAGTSSYEKVVLHVQRREMEPSIENIMNLCCFFFVLQTRIVELQTAPSDGALCGVVKHSQTGWAWLSAAAGVCLPSTHSEKIMHLLVG